MQGVTEEFPIGLALTYAATWEDDSWVERYDVMRWATEVGEHIVQIDITTYTGTTTLQDHILVNISTWNCVNGDGTPSIDVVSPPLWLNTSDWIEYIPTYIPPSNLEYGLRKGVPSEIPAGTYFSWVASYHWSDLSTNDPWTSITDRLYFEEDSGTLIKWSYSRFDSDSYTTETKTLTLTSGNLRAFGVLSIPEQALPGVLLGVLILLSIIMVSCAVYRRPPSPGIERERTVTDWINLLKNNQGDPDVRQRAAQALGQSGDFRATKPLLEVLRGDTHSRVRRAVAQALGNLRDPRAVKTLINILLREGNIDVQRGAAWALGQIGDRQTVNPLVQVLRNAESDEVRQSAVRALGQLGDYRGVTPLLHALQHDEAIEVKLSAALTLQDRWDSLSQTQQQFATRLIRDLPLRTVEEDDAELQQPVVPIPQTLQCMSCGETVKAEGTVCTKCGNLLHRCMVCQRRIGQGEGHSRCPFCGTLAHRDHLLQWLDIRTVCPHCQRTLHPRELTS